MSHAKGEYVLCGNSDDACRGRRIGGNIYIRPRMFLAVCGGIRVRNCLLHCQLSKEMSGFINYDLIDDIERIVDAGVIQEIATDPGYDERHLSELYRIITAMDDKEIYTVIRSIAENHRETLINTLEHMNNQQEGEHNNERIDDKS